MSPASVAAFRLKAAKARHTTHGIPVKFRGQDMTAIIAPIAVSLDLDTGGLRQGGDFVCRFLASDLTHAPRRGEPVIVGVRSYMITQVRDETTTPSEHVCTISPGSTL